MSEEDLETIKPRLASIPSIEVRPPNVPIDIYLSSVQELVSLLENEGIYARLVEIGVDEDALLRLKLALGATENAQMNWAIVRSQWVTEDYGATISAAESLREELTTACRWNLREDRVAIALVGAITHHEDITQLAQDLTDLGELMERRFDAFLQDRTFDVISRISEARHLANAVREGSQRETKDIEWDQAREMRDRAYAYLDQVAETLREAGRYAFRKEGHLARGFSTSRNSEPPRAMSLAPRVSAA